MKLSKEQGKPAYTESEKALVLAPAGSGKTRVLIARINHLLENKNVSSYEILSFSFTRKAANEIKERLKKQLGQVAFNITCGTIHGCALNYLQRFGELTGLTPGKITVYGPWEEQFLLKEVAMELGYHNGRTWKKIKKGDVEHVFKTFYTTGSINPDSIDENLVMNAFFSRCKENNALTYGMILITFLKIIPDIIGYLNLRHVLADEVQDLNPIQWQIINELSKNGSLFAIGDQRQAIFGFQGGDSEYIARNQNQFDLYNLQDNYRSSPNIVEAANKLISHNALNMGEPMTAKRQGRFEIIHLYDMDSGNFLDYFKAMATVPIKLKTAVLARNHFLLKKLSRLLTESDIKHEYIGKKTGLVRSEEFRRFHAFLKLVVNPFDNFSFLLIRDYINVSMEDYHAIRLTAVKIYKSHFQTWRDNCSEHEHHWGLWFKSAEQSDISTIIDCMKDIEFDFDTEEIFNFVYSWIIENPAGTIKQYLNWLATFDVSDEIKKDPEGLQLLTMHSSKGLEFPTVIICGLNEGIFPDSRSVKENDLESEARLMYVAMTRAEDQLILTSRPLKKNEDGNITNEPSRFIKWSMS